MASGKTTLGLSIANTLGWNFIDLDHKIEEKEGREIKQIFADKGEEYFRNLESKYLLEIIQEQDIVIALGGGTIIRKENLNIMKHSGVIIYLKSSPENIFLRIKNKTNRPLLLSDSGEILPKDIAIRKIKSLLAERENIYNQAQIIFNIDDTRIGYSVDFLVKKIRKMFNIK